MPDFSPIHTRPIYRWRDKRFGEPFEQDEWVWIVADEDGSEHEVQIGEIGPPLVLVADIGDPLPAGLRIRLEPKAVTP